MTPNIIRVGLLFIFISFYSSSFSQLYDFDSLYENSSQFKEAFDNVKDTFDIFNSEEILHLTITSDFRNLIKKKLKEEYQPATLETVLFDTIVVRSEIKIKPRGGIRREQHCYYPPIMLNFSKKRAVFKQFKEFDKVKFVGNCRGGDIYDEYVMLEYYAYKIYNLLSPYSFRIRLLMVTYTDISGKKKPRSNYAFIIEDIDQLAQRTDGISYKLKNLSIRHIDRKTGIMMGLFQYLIGNVDWNMPYSHNIKLIKLNDVNKPNPIAVPYDFDYSGLVNASYVTPGESWPVQDVKERFYMGPCVGIHEFDPAIKILNEKRDEIEALFRNSEYMSDNAKKRPLKYVDEFYEIINDQSAVKALILANCQ